MAAQKATELRRLSANVEANEKALRLRQDELEARLLATPAANWPEAAEKHAIFSSFLPLPSLRKIPAAKNSLPPFCVTSSGSRGNRR